MSVKSAISDVLNVLVLLTTVLPVQPTPIFIKVHVGITAQVLWSVETVSTNVQAVSSDCLINNVNHAAQNV